MSNTHTHDRARPICGGRRRGCVNSASLVNSLADHATEVSEPIQAIHLLLEGVTKARDVEDTGEAIVDQIVRAAHCYGANTKGEGGL